MVTPELLSYIKQQIALGKTEQEIRTQLMAQGGWKNEDIDEALHALPKEQVPAKEIGPIEKATKAITRYIKLEVTIIILLAVIYVGLIMVIALIPFFGIIIAIALTILISGVAYVAVAGISLVAIVHGMKINRSVRGMLTTDQASKQFKKKYHILLILSTILIILVTLIAVPEFIKRHTSIGKDAETSAQKDRNAQDRLRYIEDEKNHVLNNIREYKRGNDSEKEGFAKISEVPNNGNCENPTPHSFFNPDRALLTDNSFPNSTEKIYSGAGSSSVRYLQTFTFPKLGHCYSDQQHYAFDMPNYLENPYFNFYCIDDIHPDVQVNKKPIKGPSCDDLDQSYIPITRPVDTPITY